MLEVLLHHAFHCHNVPTAQPWIRTVILDSCYYNIRNHHMYLSAIPVCNVKVKTGLNLSFIMTLKSNEKVTLILHPFPPHDRARPRRSKEPNPLNFSLTHLTEATHRTVLRNFETSPHLGPIAAQLKCARLSQGQRKNSWREIPVRTPCGGT